MRRLADLAFLFQMYDFAYRTYHTAKRDFNNDHAWLHYFIALIAKQPFSPVSIPHTIKSDIFHKLKQNQLFL
jgi:hypothetical protein